MKNVTILLAVVAMLAVTAFGSTTVAQTFDSDPGWTTDGSTNGGNFGYDDTAHAVTGLWKASSPPHRYYTGVDAMTKTNVIYFGGDVKFISAHEYAYVGVGLFDTAYPDNTKNSVVMAIGYYNSKLTSCDSSGAVYTSAMSTGTLVLGTLYHFEVQVRPFNTAYLWGDLYLWKDGDPMPGTPTKTGNIIIGFTANAFGATSYVTAQAPRQASGVVDNLYLNTPIPEPATMVLLGLGGIGVLIRRRRK